MIQEDYVSFETAKLLKKKGFDETCRAFWKEWNGELYLCDCSSAHVFEFCRNSMLEYYNDKEETNTAAPTLQMTTKWLQVIFNVVIIPNYEYECDDTPWCYKIFRLGENGKPERVAIKGVSYDKNNNPTEHIVGYRDYECSYENYSTKEEAVEEGIKYCLENLI